MGVWDSIDRLAATKPNDGEVLIWRGRFVTVLACLGGFSAFSLAIACALAGEYSNAAANGFGIFFCTALQVAWRSWRSANLVANAFGLFCTTIYFAGFAVHRELSMVAWLAITPLLVLFLGGRKLGLLWLGIELLVMGIAIWMFSAVPKPELGEAMAMSAGSPLTRIYALMVVVFAVGLIFDLSANSVMSRLREANEAKSRFLANVSHELRTPLNGVLGMAELMAQNELPEAQRERLGVVLQSGHLLRLLIEDVLDATQLERGSLRINEGSVYPAEVAGTVLAQLQSLANAKGLGLSLEMHGVRAPMRTDSLRLMQIISNLVGNALKFTRRGEVMVVVNSTRKDNDVQLVLEVRDTGPGIPADQLNNIFEPFARLSRDALVPGTGLGLAIVQSLTELLGGKLTVRSVVGQGTTFRFELTRPGAAVSQETPMPVVRDSKAIRANVLLVDDNVVNLKVAKGLLEKLGCVVTTAPDGAQAVEAFKVGSYDLVLMDLHMPVMDGFESAKQIRARDPRVRIVALSATTVREELDAVATSGMNGHLSKPVRLDQLREVLPVEEVTTRKSA